MFGVFKKLGIKAKARDVEIKKWVVRIIKTKDGITQKEVEVAKFIAIDKKGREYTLESFADHHTENIEIDHYITRTTREKNGEVVKVKEYL